jgi:chaperonin GroEL
LVYRPKIDPQRCFVLLPLRSPFLGYFDKIIKPACADEGLLAVKADDVYGTRAVIRDIWDQIWAARIVVAIVTDQNPNVNYELGICHTLGVPTILVTERAEDVPFDYRHRRYVAYAPKEAGWEQKLGEDLGNTLRTVLSSVPLEEELPWPYSTFELHADRTTGDLIPSTDARTSIVKGVKLVREIVAPSFGPHGTAVSVIVSASNRQVQYQRGYQIAQNIRAQHPLESQGVEQMARLAAEVFNATGDTTKTSILLSCAMIERGSEALVRGCLPTHVVAGMQRAIEAASAHIMTGAKRASANEQTLVARTAAGPDPLYAELILEAIKKVGLEGVVDIVDGDGIDASLELELGLRFNQGFLSPSFVTDTTREECVLDDCFVLIHEGQIGSLEEVLRILEQVARVNKPILFVAADFSDYVLSTLVLNKEKGLLSCIAVKAPAHADRRRSILEDLAILTGGKAFLQEVGYSLQNASISDLGRAAKVVVTRRDTTIIDGAGRLEEINTRISAVRRQVATTTNLHDIASLRERLARLGGALAIIRTGGRTEAERIDSRYRLESALYSAQLAGENGFVSGGCLPYYRAKAVVERLVPANDSEQFGISAVAYALEQPIRQLIRNSDPIDRAGTLKTIKESSTGSVGYNAQNGEVEDLVESGILDAAKALTQALQLSFAYAKGILTTGAWDAGR